MNKKKRIPIIIAIVALILSGCGHKPQPSSVTTSVIDTTSEISAISEDNNSSSEDVSSSEISSIESS